MIGRFRGRTPPGKQIQRSAVSGEGTEACQQSRCVCVVRGDERRTHTTARGHGETPCAVECVRGRTLVVNCDASVRVAS
eukprot:1171851-Prymnesium_polylepis.1